MNILLMTYINCCIWELLMDKDGPSEGIQTELSKRKRVKKSGSGMSDFVRQHIPEGAVIDFIFREDFDADGQMEAIVGFTEFSPFPPESSVLYFKKSGDIYDCNKILCAENHVIFSEYGIYDNAVVADLNGDGIPKLILSLASGNGHYITLFIFDWVDGIPSLAWYSNECFYHGSVEVMDTDGDGLFEIVVESGTHAGQEILALSEACYHVREGCYFKWDGSDYVKHSNEVRMPYQSYNAAVKFLNGLWKHDYSNTYNMAIMPGFVGLEGLDDCSLTAFRKFVRKNIRPALTRNLSKSKLMPAEPYDSYCVFNGSEDDFTVELVKDKGVLKVQTLNIYKRSQSKT